MKIYTKTGDDGDTGLFGGARVSKASARVEAYGTVDELNAVLGVARAAGAWAELDELLGSIQSDLFTLGAELATVPGKEASLGIPLLDDRDVARLEVAIDLSEATLPPLKNFVLPAGTPAAAALHLARTVCRRAERAVVGLPEGHGARGELKVYLNRLSDLLFSLARQVNQRAGVEDVPWSRRA
ncbi:MAG: cob(I)yrinic acid a,c-diamide adenosyltransferase [Deltaproteobacteria bacterium]|nr:cob(I)yrinic acid a,c-diamide adenosyltransferase [Myxococcales bacterium]MDP3218221.1 cob(I)yrinic acid a,c-diamide adenosyltransferase [Deltaproteobacteria bacterium]